jgi:hypothetical protein
MIKMLCAIPESIGWASVGAIGCLCVIGLGVLGYTLHLMWKEHKEDAEQA